jgi:hypothetical protein
MSWKWRASLETKRLLCSAAKPTSLRKSWDDGTGVSSTAGKEALGLDRQADGGEMEEAAKP